MNLIMERKAYLVSLLVLPLLFLSIASSKIIPSNNAGSGKTTPPSQSQNSGSGSNNSAADSKTAKTDFSKLKPGKDYAADEVVVKFKNDVSKKELTGLSKKFNLKIKKKIPRINVYKIKIPKGQTVPQTIEKLNKATEVKYAEPNFVRSVNNVPNDSYYSSFGSWGQTFDDLYGLKKLDTQSAWDISTGSSDVVVAVSDTGLDFTHEDLAGNIWQNQGEIGTDSQSRDKKTNNVDDDGNGYIDDWRGWDSAYVDNNPTDGDGHGTHVAGTIAAVGNNSLGVVGVNWQAKVMAVKGLDDSGQGWDTDLAEGIIYAADNGAQVVNMSWSGGGVSTTIDAALEYAYGRNVVLVAAAGNDNADVSYSHPANNPRVIAVAATDSNDQRATFSNWGSGISVAAPGVDVLSLRATGTDMYGDGGAHFVPSGDSNAKYMRASGTSMASPHVAGLAALIKSAANILSNAEVRQIIEESVDDLGDPGKDNNYGYGRVNAGKALIHPLIGQRSWIKSLKPASGSSVFTTQPTITATFSDQIIVNSSSDITLKINGSIVAHTYDSSAKTIKYYPDQPLVNGKKTVSLSAIDSLNTQYSTDWSFYVDIADKGAWSSMGPYGVDNIQDIAASGSNVYLAGSNIPYSSLDNGDNWFQGNCSYCGLISVSIDPDDPNIAYGGTYGFGSYKTVDGGQTWQGMNFGGYDTSTVYDIAVGRRQGVKTIFLAGWNYSGDGVWRSVDNGKTFQKMALNLYSGRAIAVDPQNPEVVYVGGYGKVWKTQDGGDTWTDSGLQLWQYGQIESMAVDPNNANIVYVGIAQSNGGVVRSIDSGSTWQTTSLFGEDYYLTNLAVNSLNSKVFAISSGGGLYKSDNYGQDWTLLKSGSFRGLNIGNQGEIFMGESSSLDPNNVLKSVDNGQTWQQASKGLTGVSVKSVVPHPQNSDVAYAGNYKSVDKGNSWSLISSLTSSDKVLGIDPSAPDTVFASGDGFKKSIDGGLNWTLKASGLGNLSANQFVIDKNNSQRLFAASIGIVRSDDGGESWQSKSNGIDQLTVKSIAIDSVNSANVYAGAKDKIYKSTDAGDNWSTALTITGQPSSYNINALAVDPKNSGTVYAGGVYRKIFKTIDGGTTWNELTTPFYYVSSLIVDASNSNIIYAGHQNDSNSNSATLSGVSVSKDGGNTWRELTGMDKTVNALAFRADGVLMAATEGSV